MPRTLKVNGLKLPVATEEELLAFANKMREAGGAEFLEALLPSTPSNPHSCLIANACNFGCNVDGNGWVKYEDGSGSWMMNMEDTMSSSRIKAIAKAVNCPARFWDDNGNRVTARRYDILRESAREDDYSYAAIQLPKAIGNAAAAFDAGEAFQNYVR